MKRILLAVMLGTSVLGFAQNSEKKLEKMMKKQIVNKIKNYKPTDLVPYSKDGKEWALMDVKSRKILTDFVLRSPSTFNPDLHVDIYIYIEGYGYGSYVMISPDYTIRPARFETGVEPYWPLRGVESMEEPGFQMDEKGEMTKLNFKYRSFSNPILYKGEYYAVVKQEEKKILINQKGEELKEFHFESMEELHYKDKESGESIFYVKDLDGKKGFMTISGKKKLYGEIMNDFTIFNPVLGYSVQKDSGDLNEVKKSGVIDLTTQEWLIKPQEKYKIYRVKYTSSEEINEKNIQDRDKVTIYFLATDQSGQHFVLDIKGKPILPKK